MAAMKIKVSICLTSHSSVEFETSRVGWVERSETQQNQIVAAMMLGFALLRFPKRKRKNRRLIA